MFRAALHRTCVAGFATLALLGGCSPGLPAATPNDAARAHIQLADLQQGRSLTASKCSGCHRAPMPTDHPGDVWPQKLEEMSARSHLDANQRHLIEAYLVTLSTNPPVASR